MVDRGAPMQRCSAAFCRRWFHSSCLRQLPFAALVRDGRADTFTCPAHSCMSCFADAPGTLPRPSNLFVRCFFCAATYHPGEWCLPAGSIKVIRCNLLILVELSCFVKRCSSFLYFKKKSAFEFPHLLFNFFCLCMMGNNLNYTTIVCFFLYDTRLNTKFNHTLQYFE